MNLDLAAILLGAVIALLGLGYFTKKKPNREDPDFEDAFKQLSEYEKRAKKRRENVKAAMGDYFKKYPENPSNNNSPDNNSSNPPPS